MISHPLTTVINQTINTGLFPSDLKLAKTSQLFKKENPHLLINYRTISLLNTISKVFEKFSLFENIIILNMITITDIVSVKSILHNM